jgi:hypothetical protein
MFARPYCLAFSDVWSDTRRGEWHPALVLNIRSRHRNNMMQVPS